MEDRLAMLTSSTTPISEPGLNRAVEPGRAWPTDNVLAYWFTGLSGAGKSTLAQALAKHLRTLGQAVCVLDGDDLRTELCKDLSFSDADRAENMRSAAAMAQLLNSQGITVVAALISPLAAGRAATREVIGTDRFVEVHVNTPLEVCQQRDPKGLYARAQTTPLLGSSAEATPAPVCI
jgi:adenylylsulfate kinase